MSKKLFKKTVPVHTTWPTVVYTHARARRAKPLKVKSGGLGLAVTLGLAVIAVTWKIKYIRNN